MDTYLSEDQFRELGGLLNQLHELTEPSNVPNFIDDPVAHRAHMERAMAISGKIEAILPARTAPL